LCIFDLPIIGYNIRGIRLIMAKKHDYLWKGLVEDLFEDLLRFLYPDADGLFDLGRGVTFLDTELEQLFPPEEDEYALKVVDKLAKLYTQAGTEEWMLFHFEIQGLYRSDFPGRMFRYYIRILDKYGRPITAWAILTEGVRKARPDSYERSFLGTHLTYRYNVLKISELDDEALFADPNPFALAVLAAKTAFVGREIDDRQQRDKALLTAKQRLVRAMIGRNIPKDKVRALVNFLTYYVNFEFKENNDIFEINKRSLTGGSNTMGIEELLLETATKRGEKRGEKKAHAKAQRLIEQERAKVEQAQAKVEQERAKVEQERAKAYADKLESALKFKKMGIPVADIAEGLQLSVEEVEKL